ncbi:hypothetical protein [Mesorhizobium sp.]|uniref:hypothetical protein n=1 Tax=Mesorhizobium sp. TaxID=1871066 RepID=UPI0025BA26D3|nr:hypothetical protein [Mesorhizobium sp.]
MTDTATTGRERAPASLFGRIGAQNISLLIALVVLLAIFGALRPDVFFTPRNLINIGLRSPSSASSPWRRPSSSCRAGSTSRSDRSWA